jgi:Tol biopolymer transport system component/DNA-binding winged helix-turn-helix (wHTH) protein
MKGSTPSSRGVRFGVFEVDLEAGQLLKDRQRVKLQEQPFQVLAMLLERPGQVVTRDELQQRLWSADTFVDFDHGLNKAINKIREALGDSADNPRFVETLARRGYRFIAPVEQAGGERLSKSSLAVEKIPDASVPSAPTELQEVERGQTRRWTAGWTWMAVLTALTLAGVWFHFHRVGATQMNVVRFTSYPGKEKDPALSPDGQRLAFAWDGESGDNFDIYVRSIEPAGELPLTTERPLRLTTDPAAELSPTWSPDGRYLAFARVSAGNSAIYVIPPMGGQERKLTELYSVWSEGKSLDWSPTGKSLIVSAKNAREGPYSFYLISADTGDNRKLTSPPEGMRADIFPAFSPDGQTLAFRQRFASNYLYLLPLNQPEPKRLPTHTDSWGHAWSADGREIVFASLKGGTTQLWRISASGANPRPLGIGGNGSDPTISRQGNRLAYVEATYDTDIWRIEVPKVRGSDEPS